MQNLKVRSALDNDLLKIILGENNEVVSNKKEVKDGYYINTFYPFLPGITLFLNEVHATNIDVVTFPKESRMIILNYCIGGRCEFKTNTDRYRYLTDNNLSLGGYVVMESFFYPTDFYIGFEVGIIEELFTDKTRKILKEFEIDIDKLNIISEKNNGLLIKETNSKIQRLWLDMYKNNGEDLGLMKLDMLKILRMMTSSDPQNEEKEVYLTKGQTDLARAAYDRLTADISVHISMREIAEELMVSESSLKKYFKIMFNMNVSEYMRVIRLKKAAKLLTQTRLSVLEIADACGYTNQGRFAKLFKEYYGMRPLEYRHTGIDYRK